MPDRFRHRDYRIPLPGEIDAVLRLPEPMYPEDFDLLLAVLYAMRPGLVVAPTTSEAVGATDWIRTQGDDSSEEATDA